MHAPCLLITQRVWGTDPWGKLETSAEMAREVGADVVVVHPPFRWQRDYARGFVEGVALLEERTGIAFAVENMYPWRASRREMQVYAPHWDPVGLDYANTTLDVSHAATARMDSLELAKKLGTGLRHLHLTDGSGSAKDEHLIPGRGTQPVGELLEHLAAPVGSAGTWSSRSTPGGPAAAAAARPTSWRAWRSPGCTSPRRRGTPGEQPVGSAAGGTRQRRTARSASGGTDTRGQILEAARESFAAKGFRATTIRAVAADAGRRRRARAPLLRHEGRPLRRLARDPDRPAERDRGGVRPRPRRAGERLLATVLAVWDEPEGRRPLVALVRSSLGDPASTLLQEGLVRVVFTALQDQLGEDAEVRAGLVATQMLGLIVGRYVVGLEPIASMPRERVVALVGPTLQRYLPVRLPVTPCP